ncbi:MAG: hypothetical protein U5K72_18200 [Balneolaceae bacterium]|nr:hypothetical protein [Balneolaceae bacterium]
MKAGTGLPFIVRWPGVVEPGTVTMERLSFMDMLATFADITGKGLPDNTGRTVSAYFLLTGEQPETEAIIQ